MTDPELYIVVERDGERVRYVEKVRKFHDTVFQYPYGLVSATGEWFDPNDADEVRRKYGLMLSGLALNDCLHRLDPKQLRLPSKIEDVLEPPPIGNGRAGICTTRPKLDVACPSPA